MKQKNIRIYYALAGIVTFFIANFIDRNFIHGYEGGNLLMTLVVFIAVASIIQFLVKRFVSKTYPREYREMTMNAKDERAKEIQGKAAYYTLMLNFLSLLVILVLPEGVITDYQMLLSFLFIALFFVYLILLQILDQ